MRSWLEARMGRCALARGAAVRLALVLAALGCSIDDRAVTSDSAAGGASGMMSSSPAGALGSLGTGGTEVSAPPQALRPLPTKLDLLLLIDNSIAMADKQELLRLAVPDLMSRLVNPICVDAAGNELPAPSPGAECPAGQRRQFAPFRDVNVGVISSSLGDFGSEVSCPSARDNFSYRPEFNDMAHLAGSLERSTSQTNELGFVEWRAGSSELDQVTAAVQRMVTDMGETGCGWESSLESWYRFLIDPAPYQQLVRVVCPNSASTAPNCVAPATDASGERLVLDETLLAQRAGFLRDDSLLAIVMLTDENDCSARVGAQTWVAFDVNALQPMFRGSSECAADPNGKCCYSCPLGPPAGCVADDACTANAAAPNRLAAAQDGPNLRCFDQRRRFGASFLYPTERYVNALTQPQLCLSASDLSTAGCAAGALLPNPLFERGRLPAHVLLTGIVGVPWQALAASRNFAGRAIDASVLRFRSHAELAREGGWRDILGEPGTEWRAATATQPEVASSPRRAPLLAQMVESAVQRSNVASGNPINGREYDTAQGSAPEAPIPNALQYACIFPLPTPVDCEQDPRNAEYCECQPGTRDRPLCELTPGVSMAGSVQYWGKASPGLRQLAVLNGVGEQTGNSVVGSICARNTTDDTRTDFGYRPAISALFERLQAQLAAP